MAGVVASFSALDYVIFALMLAVSAGIGIFYGCFGSKTASAKEMLVANRQMTVFPTAMSLLASFMSGITILGNPSEVYNYGTMFWWNAIAYIMITIVTANVFIPLFHRLELTSAYEYLERRFNRYVKLMASIIFCVQMTIYMALVLYAPALALSQVTGLNTWISVVSIGLVCTFYTTIGGMKAVMWTDVFQIIMMFIGLLSSLIKGIMDVGSIRKVIEINWVYERIEFLVFDPNPTTRHTVWGLTLGSFFQWLAIYGVNQSQVQRYLSVPTAKHAKRAIYWNLLGLIFILSLTLSVGLVIFAKYHTCDPLSTKRVEINEQLYPLYVMETLNTTVGLPGLFLACLFSAALSTISSGLNSLAAVVLEDIIKGFFIPNLSDQRAATFSKILCIAFGIACLVITYGASFLGALLQAALSLFGVIGGPLLGVFCLGIFVPFANPKGAIVGTLCGLAFTIWIFAGLNIYGIKYPKKPMFTYGCPNSTIANTTSYVTMDYTTTTPIMTQTLSQKPVSYERHGIEAFHSISYVWYGFLAVSVTCIVGSIVSLLTGRTKPGEVDTSLMIPLVSKILCCFPKSMQPCLQCGYNYRKDSDAIDKSDKEFITNMVLESKANLVEEEDADSVKIVDELYANRNKANNSNNVSLRIEELGKENKAFSESNTMVTKF